MIEVNNSKYGFCTKDVINCNDMAKLKQWLREQQDTLSSLSLSVERMKQSAQDGNPNDRYFSTCSAKRLQVLFFMELNLLHQVLLMPHCLEIKIQGRFV